MPADDLTDPAPATTFTHLDAKTVLSRSIAELGIYPAVDPLESTSRALDPQIVGEEHYRVAAGVQEILQNYKDLQDIIAILGMDELSEEQKLIGEPRPQDPEVPRPAVPRGRESSPACPGKYVKLEDTIRSFKPRSSTASATTSPSSASVYKGAIEDVYAAYDEMQKKEA